MKNIDEEYFRSNIAKKVREYRKDTSQELLADNADVSEDTISKIEREITIMSSLTLVKICNALGVTPNDILIDFLDDFTKINTIDNQINSEIKKLSEKDKELVLRMIKLIKEYNK